MISKQCAQYLTKTAAIGLPVIGSYMDVGELSKKIPAAMLPWVVGLVAAGGAGVGYLASRATSPDEAERDLMKKNILRGEVEAELALARRDLDTMRRKHLRETGAGRRDLAL
jgi:hypothetical protein